MEQPLRIAVLIDAENVSSKYIKLIIDEVTGFGIPTYKRVYANFSNTSATAWQDVLRNYALTPVFQFNYTRGKNASDSAIIIDAMDILYSGQVDGFCLVTSDSDFTKLALRLREAGMLVIGMGEQKTPESLVSACETFKFLDLLYANALREEKEAAEAEEPVPEEDSHIKSDSKQVSVSRRQLRGEIMNIIRAKGDEEGWTDLSLIGNLLSKRVPGFDPRNYNFTKLGKLIESYNFFEKKTQVNEKNELIQLYFRTPESPRPTSKKKKK